MEQKDVYADVCELTSHWASTAEALDVVVCAFVLDMSQADSEGVGILTRLFLSEKCSVVAGSPVLPPRCTPGKASRVLH